MSKINCANLTLEDYQRLKAKFGDAKAHYLWNKLNGEIPQDLDALAKENIRFRSAQVLLPWNKLLDELRDSGLDVDNMSHEEIKKLINPEVLRGLSYRIPNQDAPSNDAFEVVGILPAAMGDTIIAYKEITVKTGSDFDIDKAYIILPNFEYNDKTKKLEVVRDKSKKGLQNRRLDLMRAMLTNVSGYGKAMQPLDAPWLKDLIYGTKDVPGLIKQDTSIEDLYFFTGTNQTKTKSLFDGGKSLVGVVAKHMTHQNLVKHEDISFNNYYIGKGVAEELKDIKIEGEIEKEVVIGKQSRVSVELDEDGNSVSETLIAYANAIVDAAKDPFVLKANINLFTANTAFMLARAGVSRNWISAFMLQPILVDLVQEMAISEGRIAPEERNESGETIKALDKVLKKYNISSSGTAFKKTRPNLKQEYQQSGNNEKEGEITITTDKLISYINKSIEDIAPYPALAAEQGKILGQFLEWQEKANTLSNLMKITSSDTEGATKNDLTANMKDDLFRKVIMDGEFTNLDKLIGFNVTEDGNIVFNDSRFIGTMHKNSVQLLIDTAKQLFVTSSKSFRHSLFNIARYAGYNFLQDEDLARVIENELYAAMIADSEILSFDSKEDLARLLFTTGATGEHPSLAERIMEAKKTMKDNDLIQALAVNLGFDGSPSTISLSSKVLDVDAKNNLYLNWEDLLASDKKLGEDLIKYAFYSSGLAPNFGVFYEHIPTSYLIENGLDKYLKKQLVDLNANSNGLSHLEDSVFRHLYKNNKIVPTISNIIIRKDVKTKDGMEISPEDFLFIDEFNAGNLKIGEDKNKKSVHKTFIKRKLSTYIPETDTLITYIKLYKLAGYKDIINEANGKISRVAIYERTNPLGTNKGINIIKEYGTGSTKSIFKANEYNIDPKVYNAIKNDKSIVDPEPIVLKSESYTTKSTKTKEELEKEFIYCNRKV